jgi:hypothetical protein
MPQHKSPNPRKVILPVRFSESELNELATQARGMPLSTWVRKRALDPTHPSPPAPAQSEPLPPPTLEGGAPAPLRGERYTDYQRRLDCWAIEALSDHAQRARLEIATRIGVNYVRTR